MKRFESLQHSRQRVPFEDRYWNSIMPVPNSGCYIWLGHVDTRGYASSKFGYGKYRKTMFVHRVAYQYFVGTVPKGYDLDHLCRVRCCVNPAHLEPVTRKVNSLRGAKSSLRILKTECPRGHKYTPENSKITKYGHVKCRECHKIANRLLYNRKQKL